MESEGNARHGMTWKGKEMKGMEFNDMASQCMSWNGRERHGMIWKGKEMQGMAFA
jgi:hypothetical protein